MRLASSRSRAAPSGSPACTRRRARRVSPSMIVVVAPRSEAACKDASWNARAARANPSSAAYSEPFSSNVSRRARRAHRPQPRERLRQEGPPFRVLAHAPQRVGGGSREGGHVLALARRVELHAGAAEALDRGFDAPQLRQGQPAQPFGAAMQRRVPAGGGGAPDFREAGQRLRIAGELVQRQSDLQLRLQLEGAAPANQEAVRLAIVGEGLLPVGALVRGGAVAVCGVRRRQVLRRGASPFNGGDRMGEQQVAGAAREMSAGGARAIERLLGLVGVTRECGPTPRGQDLVLQRIPHLLRPFVGRRAQPAGRQQARHPAASPGGAAIRPASRCRSRPAAPAPRGAIRDRFPGRRRASRPRERRRRGPGRPARAPG